MEACAARSPIASEAIAASLRPGRYGSSGAEGTRKFACGQLHCELLFFNPSSAVPLRHVAHQGPGTRPVAELGYANTLGNRLRSAEGRTEGLPDPSLVEKEVKPAQALVRVHVDRRDQRGYRPDARAGFTCCRFHRLWLASSFRFGECLHQGLSPVRSPLASPESRASLGSQVNRVTQLTLVTLVTLGSQVTRVNRVMRGYLETPVSLESQVNRVTQVMRGYLETPVSLESQVNRVTQVTRGSQVTRVNRVMRGYLETPVSLGSQVNRVTQVTRGYLETPVSLGSQVTRVSLGSQVTQVTRGYLGTPVSRGRVAQVTRVTQAYLETPVSRGRVAQVTRAIPGCLANQGCPQRLPANPDRPRRRLRALLPCGVHAIRGGAVWRVRVVLGVMRVVVSVIRVCIVAIRSIVAVRLRQNDRRYVAFRAFMGFRSDTSRQRCKRQDDAQDQRGTGRQHLGPHAYHCACTCVIIFFFTTFSVPNPPGSTGTPTQNLTAGITSL